MIIVYTTNKQTQDNENNHFKKFKPIYQDTGQ